MRRRRARLTSFLRNLYIFNFLNLVSARLLKKRLFFFNNFYVFVKRINYCLVYICMYIKAD